MKGLGRSPGGMSRNILLLGLLQWAILSQISIVLTDAAKADLAYGRKLRQKVELEGSMARYQQLITHEEFSLRNLLKVETKMIEDNQDVGPEVERQSEEISVENLNPMQSEEIDAQQQHGEVEGQEGGTENKKSQQQQSAKEESEQEQTQEKEEPHKINQEQHERTEQTASDDETEPSTDAEPQSKTEEHLEPTERQNVAEEENNIEEEQTNEDPQSKTEEQQEPGEGQNEEEEKNNAEKEKGREEKEEPFVAPEPPYLLGPTIKDWDEQRGSWLNANPHMKTTSDGKPRVLLVTGSQPEPCESSLGDNLNVKSLKLKMDYARMHNYEIYYNIVWLDPLFGSYWVKLPTIRQLMLTHPEIEWFFWVDSDAIFTDMLFEAPFETYEGYNMIMWGINDYFYAERSWTAYNAGVFMIRNCQWTLDLIDKWSPMGPQGEHRNAYGKLLTSFLKGRGDWPSDDQSALAYLMITDEAVKAKVKLVDSDEYMISGWWVGIVERYEEMMEKFHPGLGGTRWPWITHFTGCGPCYHDDTTPEYKKCMENMDRAFHFADNQVLAYMGYQHESLSSPEVIRLRNETDRPLELLGVNPWADRIAEVAAMEGGSST